MKTTSNGNGTSQGNGIPAQSTTADRSSFLSESLTSDGSESLSQSDRDTILSLMTQMRDLLPFLQDLTAAERKSLLGMGDKNRVFAGKVLEIIQQNVDFLPRSFDIEKFQQDLETFDRLSTILMALNQLRDLVEATAISIGSEAYEEALEAYRYAKASGRGASLEAMMADLKLRFARKPKKQEGKPEVPESNK